MPTGVVVAVVEAFFIIKTYVQVRAFFDVMLSRTEKATFVTDKEGPDTRTCAPFVTETPLLFPLRGRRTISKSNLRLISVFGGEVLTEPDISTQPVTFAFTWRQVVPLNGITTVGTFKGANRFAPNTL